MGDWWAMSADAPDLMVGKDHFLTKLHVVPDERGKLCVIERGTGLPFDIHRVYYLYDVPSGTDRGGHAHLQLQQLLIPISGSFSVRATSRSGEHTYRLYEPNTALYIGPGVWRELLEFSSNAVCLVLASMEYDEADYIRSREAFDRRMKSA
ncbi:MAG: FdtA/QdtA family cupin domain-containing protein [Rhizobiaceae bacterium]|jgi:dTDP-4-dehydrorhamnose 3,5-epimerase-like enzyme|nr:FdtA/QdtA family cupin domain-containing protein [Rhizobiaceae bacterium]